MFSLTLEQIEKLNQWKSAKDLNKYTGAVGGRFTYCFTSTSFGMVVKVKDGLDNDEIDLSDYENW